MNIHIRDVPSYLFEFTNSLVIRFAGYIELGESFPYIQILRIKRKGLIIIFLCVFGFTPCLTYQSQVEICRIKIRVLFNNLFELDFGSPLILFLYIKCAKIIHGQKVFGLFCQHPLETGLTFREVLLRCIKHTEEQQCLSLVRLGL